MTDSVAQKKPRTGKRERLVEAAARVFYERGVEKTTIADIAQAADVPVGNVYYYFKTKDQFVQAVLETHAGVFAGIIAAIEPLPTPPERLKAMVRGWVEERDQAARYGCPTGSLAAELDKRDDAFGGAPARVMGLLIDWARTQFAEMGRPDADELAIAFVAAYQGISLLTNTFRDPELMVTEGARLERWIDELAGR
ncbi:TetR family transcriptional regulator [Nocardia neocaledoniensis NBRC 108232]|uniref:TetR family transcriptional regulator n=1 Tax=Nocardia neocaledoniensis TaxID=236511 RepID=A0A317P031_9NOCA|nr:TetR/AcrR family transcriptional regulator [Nocardia neocaledoniensis]PWV80919.1 TetR family transcriptional regulator [Nocardia neocaledoniensis]GEM35341.1 TetR family transcriptional regulator [Nocardia neocaledoniensis NBRC 108232]